MQLNEKYMFPFFETIRIIDGIVIGSDRHLDRMENTCLKNYGEFNHGNIFGQVVVPEEFLFGSAKLNIYYNSSETDFQISKYTPKPIQYVNMVDCRDWFDYSFKYTNREQLDMMLKFSDGADDIIIVRGGMITDSSKANIVFEKDGKFYTPDTFLLNGTMRQYLLKTGKIIEQTIIASDIRQYESIYFINALNPIELAPKIGISTIR